MNNINNPFRLVAILLTSLTFMCATSQVYSEPLIVGASYAPPYYTVDEDRQVSGLLVDLVSSVMADTDQEIIWRPYPTKRVYSNLIRGGLDLYLGPLKSDIKGFDSSIIHSETSPINIELVCYYLGDKPAISKKEQFSGNSMILRRGYTYGGLRFYIKNPANRVKFSEVESFNQAIRMLKKGRANYYLDYKKTGESYLAQHPEINLKQSTLFSVDLHFMMSNKTPNAKAILEKIEESYLRFTKRQLQPHQMQTNQS